jgi:hypothetical protein
MKKKIIVAPALNADNKSINTAINNAFLDTFWKFIPSILMDIKKPAEAVARVPIETNQPAEKEDISAWSIKIPIITGKAKTG